MFCVLQAAVKARRLPRLPLRPFSTTNPTYSTDFGGMAEGNMDFRHMYDYGESSEPSSKKRTAEEQIIAGRGEQWNEANDTLAEPEFRENANKSGPKRYPFPVPPAAYAPPLVTDTMKAHSELMNIPPMEDPLLKMLAAVIMKDGKLNKARRIVYRMLWLIHSRTRAPPLPLFRQAIFSITPTIRCRKDKRGTRVIPVPLPLFEKQGTRIAIGWLSNRVRVNPKSKKRKEEGTREGGRSLEERLAWEVIQILRGKSKTIALREARHSEAAINRGNAMRVMRG